MSFFSKMYRVSQLSLMGVSLNNYSGRLPRLGIMRNGDIYPHTQLARPTCENGGSASRGGIWVTPTASDTAQRAPSPTAVQTANGTY